MPKEYHRAHYANRSPESKAEKVRVQGERRRRIAAAVAEFKRGKACACGEGHPACLDFHHTGDDKDETVANAVRRGWSIERTMAEVAKCMLVCSNCHRKLHFAERTLRV